MKPLPTLKLGIADLNAFRVTARSGSITHAARLLHMSQSALSRRLRRLEDRLQVCLFLRGVHGVMPTESGRRLLRHVDTLCLREQELIAELRGQHPLSLHGLLRIAGSASMLRGVALPALAPLLRENPGALLEFHCEEHVPERLLAEARADLVIASTGVARRGTQATRLGTEVLLLMESSRHRAREEIFLPPGGGDDVLDRWVGSATPAPRHCATSAELVRHAVEMGLGRGLFASHALDAGDGLRRVEGVEPLVGERWIHHARDTRHARLVAAVVERLTVLGPDLLARDAGGWLAEPRC